MTERGPALVPALGFGAASVLVFVRAWTFDPFLTRTNLAQRSYIAAAEALTGPEDTVLDGAGLVLTRKPPHKDWMLHSLHMGRYRAGERVHFAKIMVEHPSPVILDNYRWSWLSPEDLLTRQARYVELEPRLLVLGQHLRASEGELPVHHRGNYRLDAAAGVIVRVDDEPLRSGSVLSLEAGPHRYARLGDGAAIIHWVGPNPQRALDALERISSLGPAEEFFTNEPKPPQR